MANTVQAQSTSTPYRVTLTDPSGHQWFADEPTDKGGRDTAPNPVQLLLSALGACTHYNYTRNVCKSQRD